MTAPRFRGQVGWVLAVTIAMLFGVVAPSGAADKKGHVTYFSLGITPGAYVQSITAGPVGNLWFTADRIGRITPAGEITEFSAGLTDADPSEITAGPDGNLWFTEGYVAENPDGALRTYGRIGGSPPLG